MKKDFQVGDAVAIRTGGWHSSLEKRKVVKTTATQLVLDDGSRWLKRGRKVGASTWSREWLEPWDEQKHQEMVAESRRQQLARECDALPFASMTADQLERIKAIAKETK